MGKNFGYPNVFAYNAIVEACNTVNNLQGIFISIKASVLYSD